VRSFFSQNGNTGDTQTLALQELVGGVSIGNSVAWPAISFQEAGINGGYRHFIRSRHDYFDGVSPQILASNAIDFYTNNSTNPYASTGPGTGNVLAMSVTSAGVGIGTSTPEFNLDVDGNARVTSNTTSSNFTTPTASSNNIGGVTLSNNNIAMSGTIIGSTVNTSNQIGGVTLSNNTISNSGQLTSSNVRVQAGVSNIPTYAFTSDPSAGLFTPNVGTMAFSTGGLTRMCISGTNVGIGTRNPTQFLDVSGGQTRLTNSAAALALTSGIGNSFMLFQNTSGQRRWGFGVSNAETGFNYGSDYKVSRFDDAGNEITGDPCLAITRWSGCVGIGTSDPNEQLEVNGGSIQVRNPSAGTIGSAFSNGIAFRATNELSQDKFAIARIVPTLDAANDVFGLSFQTNTNTTTRITEKMRLTGGGNLGIGMSNPEKMVDITSPVLNQGIRITAPSAQLELINPTTPGIMRLFNNGSNNGIFSGIPLMTFWTDNTQRMCISGTNVGIGTTTPAYPLDVNAGTTAASINMTSWPRSSMSFSHVAVGNVGMGSTASVCMLFSNAKVSLDSNLGDITNNSVNGTYFVCKRSGIWSITYGCRAGAATVATAIDVSTGVTDNATAGSAPLRSLALMATGNAVSLISYTGYLPSNTGYYYKFKLNSPNAANSNEARLQITFICEQPNVTGYPL
jgi:hypothetical protein